MKRKITFLFACLFVGLFAWRIDAVDRIRSRYAHGHEKANALVVAYAKHAGAHDAVHQTLDAQNDRSFGDFGFHYFPEKGVFQARVFIIRSHLGDSPEITANVRRVDAGMSDPTIGGMYGMGGGYLFDDQQRGGVCLMKDFPLSDLTASRLIAEMDNLNDLGGVWLTQWLGHLANQSLGHELKPRQRITRQDNPYKQR